MIVENGKRYVRADGEVSGVIGPYYNWLYPHADPDSFITYTANGEEFAKKVRDSPFDLVSEYIEPSPHEYGPWIPWAGGECPVADGVMGQVQFANKTRDDVEKEYPLRLHVFTWANTPDESDIIYYRVLLTEPKAVETVGPSTAPIWLRVGVAGDHRKAIITVQGDSIKAEWAE